MKIGDKVKFIGNYDDLCEIGVLALISKETELEIINSQPSGFDGSDIFLVKGCPKIDWWIPEEYLKNRSV